MLSLIPRRGSLGDETPLGPFCLRPRPRPSSSVGVPVIAPALPGLGGMYVSDVGRSLA